MKKKLKRVLIMAGGTGGHIFPGLAIAQYMRSQNVEVHWLGTPQGQEAHLVPSANIPLHFITINGLRGKRIQTLLAAPFKLVAAIWQSRRIIKRIQPDVVIGMGGFASGPGGIASWFLQRPLIIHEQNAKAGFTNKILGVFAKKILAGFPDAFPATSKVVTIGNPVRQEIADMSNPTKRLQHSPKLRLLVLGGSLGAQALNEIMPKALAQMPNDQRPEVMHQTGEKNFAQTQDLYAAMQVTADLVPFITDMAHAYHWADMVLCRAGALTIAELCAAGLGAILVPYPFAVDDHQTANAHFMTTNGAAICIQQKDLMIDRLVDLIKQFTDAPEKRMAMAEAAYRLRYVNAVEKIFAICEEICP
jgi:UDP-N-acetylglucosamine--N-acetylmuramyl-(pentapeptide) pyrophosphoryl-undecaprenol N-acetylglucosamine transferase